MNDSKLISVIGGLPHPVGGVTSFISRIAARNMASEIIDLYPSDEKHLPPTYSGKVEFLGGLIGFLFYYYFHLSHWSGRLIHFNFSSAKSALFFLLLPKFGAKFALMLHHGELKVSRFRFLYHLSFARIDFFFCMNDQQESFYKQMSIPESKNVRVSSYIPPIWGLKDSQTWPEIDSFFDGNQVFITSGYPTAIYNHEWCIRYVVEHSNYKLALFLYGDGEEKEKINKLSSRCNRIKVFHDYGQNAFNYALSKSFLYLRPTSRDSFGIAVGDAIELGIKVLASDVCKRYPGVNLFSPRNYSVFCDNLGKILHGETIRVEEARDFYPFSYPDLRLLKFKGYDS